MLSQEAAQKILGIREKVWPRTDLACDKQTKKVG